jgi:hypothetical protein
MGSIPVTPDIVRVLSDDRLRQASQARHARHARQARTSTRPVTSGNRHVSALSSLLIAIRARTA